MTFKYCVLFNVNIYMTMTVMILDVLDVVRLIFTFVTFQHFKLIQFAVIVFLVLPHNDHLGSLEITYRASKLLALHICNIPGLRTVTFSPVKHHVAPLQGLIFTKLAFPDIMCRYRVFAVV